MIKKKTTLVLGAGASVAYGFPTGNKLLEQLCDAERNLVEVALFRELGLLEKSAEIRESLLNSAASSIDNFLSRKDGVDLRTGKLMLAYQLANCELHQQLLKHGIEDDWYRYLWHHMLTEWRTPEELVGNNRLSVVTFNYDRSLEHFLTTVIAKTFGRTDGNANKIRNHLVGVVLHVYGQLGGYFANSREQARAYEPTESVEALERAAKDIEIIPEARDDSGRFDTARRILVDADQIAFLGFGFDETNVRRLNLAKVLRDRREAGRELPRIVCTVIGSRRKEADIERQLTEGVVKVEFFNKKIVDTLRESELLLT
jgi:hypothetical protein